MGVLIKNGINYTGATGIIDSVGSTSSALALSANQGNKLASNMGAIELTDSASRAYAINDYFVWKSQFVRATKAISAGDTILISGTNANVESTNIGSVLSELNSAWDEKRTLRFVNISGPKSDYTSEDIQLPDITRYRYIYYEYYHLLPTNSLLFDTYTNIWFRQHSSYRTYFNYSVYYKSDLICTIQIKNNNTGDTNFYASIQHLNLSTDFSLEVGALLI